ncbi:MAG: hypothetical protein MK041_06965 [Aquabacterium sp.]|nr:hypothetical protein [Aquabacterium sp.]
MTTMSYRGCTARVEFDDRDDIFVGRVLEQHTLISVHGKTVQELRQAFEAAVDDFLRTDAKVGFEQEAESRYARMLTTGRSIAWVDMRRYLQERADGRPATPPVSRKPVR